MLDTSLSRRRLLAGASATTTLGLLGATPVRAKAPMLNTPAPAFYRFKLGSIEATVVSDGPLAIGPASRTFRGPTAEEVGKMMSDHFLPADNVVLDQNVLVINTGDKLALFETGMSSVNLKGWYQEFPDHTVGGSLYAVPAESRLEAARLLHRNHCRIHVDLIVTPEEVIRCRRPRGHRLPKVRRDELTDDKIAAIPLLQRLRPAD